MTKMIAVEISVGRLGIAVTCAVVAAFSYALSNVLQQHEAEQIPEDKTLKLGLLTQLAHRPRWLFGISADVAGYVFEALALGQRHAGARRTDPRHLVAPLAVPRRADQPPTRRSGRMGRRRGAGRRGIGLPRARGAHAGHRGPGDARVARRRAADLPVRAGVRRRARAAQGANRAVFLGLGAGTLFGASAVLTKAFVHYLGGGVFAWVPHWEPYALAVCSITGLVLAQSAFQTGALAAAVGAEQVMQPLTGVALGVGLLDEKLGLSGSVEKIMVVAALAAMLWGVLTLARVEHPSIIVHPHAARRRVAQPPSCARPG